MALNAYGKRISEVWIGSPVGEVELELLLPSPLTALEVLGEVDAKRIMRLTLHGSSILVVYAKGLPPDQPSERHMEAPSLRERTCDYRKLIQEELSNDYLPDCGNSRRLSQSPAC